MLTEKRKKILQYLIEYSEENGRCPTVREICQFFKLNSTNGVFEHLKALEKDGFITIDKNKARGIRINKNERIYGIQVLGEIAAGEPMFPVIEEGESLNLPETIVRGKFLLKVKGDSMIGAGINSGDFVSIEIEREIKNNDIVVAVIEGEVTLKRFKKVRDKIYLQPENPNYSPILLSDKNFQILGKATMLIRKLT